MSWVFGYGSLMWRPGFTVAAAHPAVLTGYHRAFCRYSFRHRGTPAQPGLVMGLMPGGTCQGMALAIPPADEPAVLDYLDEREGDGYIRTTRPLALQGDGTGTVESWVYLPNEAHPSFFGSLPPARIVELLATGVGESGTSLDYLRSLLIHLREMGVTEPDWEAYLREAEALAGTTG